MNRTPATFVLLLCLITPGNVCASPTPPVDELDDVVQAVNAAITTLNGFIKTNKEQITATRADLTTQSSNLRPATSAIKSIIESLRTAAESDRSAFRKDIRDRATADALAKLVEAARQAKEAEENDYAVANVEGVFTAFPFVASQKSASVLANSVAVEFAKLLEEARTKKSLIEDQMRAIDEKITALKDQLEKLERMYQVIETLLPKLLDLLSQDTNAQKTKGCFTHITQDRTYAAKLLAAVRANLNNATGLSQFLRNQTPGSNIDVREVKETTGLIVVFRIGGLTHCLSTKQQCGGKPYALTR